MLNRRKSGAKLLRDARIMTGHWRRAKFETSLPARHLPDYGGFASLPRGLGAPHVARAALFERALFERALIPSDPAQRRTNLTESPLKPYRPYSLLPLTILIAPLVHIFFAGALFGFYHR